MDRRLLQREMSLCLMFKKERLLLLPLLLAIFLVIFVSLGVDPAAFAIAVNLMAGVCASQTALYTLLLDAGGEFPLCAVLPVSRRSYVASMFFTAAFWLILSTLQVVLTFQVTLWVLGLVSPEKTAPYLLEQNLFAVFPLVLGLVLSIAIPLHLVLAKRAANYLQLAPTVNILLTFILSGVGQGMEQEYLFDNSQALVWSLLSGLALLGLFGAVSVLLTPKNR